MATEIELKAHVADSETLRKVLLEKSEYLWSFQKDDSYWNTMEGASGIRIRKEKRTFSEGTEKSTLFATYKNKELKGNIEVNNEQEFEICPSTGQVFENFLTRMGLKPLYSKKKRGWAFNHDGITAELVEVKGLGWFIELEILLEGESIAGNQEKTVAETEKRLKVFLAALGIAETAIESRYYSVMLAERGITGDSSN